MTQTARKSADDHNGGAASESDTRRAVAAAAIGNATEWYDFGIFSYLTTILAKVFFPDSGLAVVATFATFSVAFAARPLGGMVFGPLGDKIGRQRVLAITMLMMAAGTLAIGLLPPFSAVGVWAPILLVTCRLVQGFSTGGEYAGAATFVAEYAPDNRRGFLGSFLELGTLAGYATGACLATALTVGLGEDSPTMLQWGWRIPFLVAGPLGAAGLYLRYKLEDSPTFRAAQQDGDDAPGAKLSESFTRHWRPLLFCIAVLLVFNIADYAILTYLPEFLGGELHLGTTTGLMVVVGVMLAMMLLVNPAGRLSDKVGRRPVLLTGCAGFLVLPIPAFLLMRQHGLVLVVLGVLLLGVPLALVLGTMPATLPALFSTKHRYGTFAIAYNLGTAAFGGTTPVIMAALVPRIGTLAPAYWIMSGAVVSLVAVWFMAESAGRPLS
jgi:MHS family proline/betaine transporter-like MFS transporter